jgi:hypothetical protein
MQCVTVIIDVSFRSINKRNGDAVELKLKASAVLQRIEVALNLPPLWPRVVECCASTVRALMPKVLLVG